jgi:hypothetical protein
MQFKAYFTTHISLFACSTFFPYFFRMKLLIATSLLVLMAGCAGNEADSQRTEPTPRKDSPLTTMATAHNALLAIDRSAMDMAYFPVDYPIQKTTGKVEGPPMARVIFSRPSRHGRAIFGNLVPYGHPWRMGANEATELELFAPATIQGKNVNKGRYILYCIPEPNQWTFVLNTNLYTWGLKQDSTKDAYRFTVPVNQRTPMIEHFTMVFAPAENGANLITAWEQSEAQLPIQFR